MPLSKKRDRERKFQPNSNLDNTDTVQPNRAKIGELRDMMQDITRGINEVRSIDSPPDDIGNDWDDIGDDIDDIFE